MDSGFQVLGGFGNFGSGFRVLDGVWCFSRGSGFKSRFQKGGVGI